MEYVATRQNTYCAGISVHVVMIEIEIISTTLTMVDTVITATANVVALRPICIFQYSDETRF
jgi:hypothetical protein